MILFHVEALDFDRPDVKSRAWLPVVLLRRAGLAAEVVAGDVPSERLSAAECLILTGGASGSALNVAQKAATSRIPIILDIGSVEILNESLAAQHREQLVEVAALAVAVTAGNAALAHHVEDVLGIAGVLVAPDPIEIEDGLLMGLRTEPGATLRAVGAWIEAAARDDVARVRRGRKRDRPSRGEQVARSAAASAVPGYRSHRPGRRGSQRPAGYRGARRGAVEDRRSGIAALACVAR